MRKYTILIAFMALYTSQLQAQVDRKVEITKAYIPTVEKATKPQLKAVIADTAYIYPDVDYSITPLSINTPLQTQPINPATVTYWEFNRPATAQIRVGAGFPLNTLFDGYVSTHNASVGYAAANVNHAGNYSKIDDVNATEVLNNIDFAAGLYIADRTLHASTSYYNNSYHNYASQSVDVPNINFQQVAATVEYSDKFTDLTKLNYGISGGYAHFFDCRMNINNELSISADIAKSITLGNLYLSVDYNAINSSNTYANKLFSISALLDKQLSAWRINIGVGYTFDKTILDTGDTPHNYLIPRLRLYKSESSPIAPFIELGGTVTANNYARLSKINPYVSSDAANESSAEYFVAGGAMGQTNSSTLSYRVYASHTIGSNSQFWGLTQLSNDEFYSSYFNLDVSSLYTTSFDLELKYMPLTNLALKADGHYYLYVTDSSTTYTNSRPAFEASIGAEYLLRKFKIGINAKAIGNRDFTVNHYTPTESTQYVEELPTVVNLSAYAQWSLNDKFVIFAEGDNLCNANLYPWPTYKGFGATVTAGVKINFR